MGRGVVDGRYPVAWEGPPRVRVGGRERGSDEYGGRQDPGGP